MAVVTTVLIAQSPQAQGQITTPTFTAPQTNPVPYFELLALMDAPDIADTTLSIGMTLQIRDSLTSVWKTVVSQQWKGNSDGLPPGVGWRASSVFGVVCRGILVLPKALSIGINGRITT